MTAAIDAIRATWKKLTANPDDGYASETVLVTALLILCALVVIGLITAKVTSKANTIDLGHPPPNVSTSWVRTPAP
jgi:hypothetical protein